MDTEYLINRITMLLCHWMPEASIDVSDRNIDYSDTQKSLNHSI